MNLEREVAFAQTVIKELAELHQQTCDMADEYFRGFANGLLCSLGVLTKKEPTYVDPVATRKDDNKWLVHCDETTEAWLCDSIDQAQGRVEQLAERNRFPSPWRMSVVTMGLGPRPRRAEASS